MLCTECDLLLSRGPQYATAAEVAGVVRHIKNCTPCSKKFGDTRPANYSSRVVALGVETALRVLADPEA